MAKERLEMTGPVGQSCPGVSRKSDGHQFLGPRGAVEVARTPRPAPTSNPRSKFRSINAKIRFSLSLSFLADQSKRIILQRHPIRSRSINLDNEKYLKECIYMYMYGGTTPSKTVYLINGEGEGRGRATGVTSCR